MLKLINDIRKENDEENSKIIELEKKIDEIDDALDEFRKLARLVPSSSARFIVYFTAHGGGIRNKLSNIWNKKMFKKN